MTDRANTGPLSDLPIQATGSGVADLEIAFEQMKVEAAADGSTDAAVRPGDADAADSEAHPS